MRHITKSPEPKDFRDWKLLENENWKPTWDNLMNPEKQILLNLLTSEQLFLCCYCGIYIDIQANNCHIEHLKPRESYPELELDYNNLLASCNGILTGQHCGHKKSNWFEEDKIVTPLDPHCLSYFRYTSAGEILPSENPEKEEPARETILRLNLNYDGLVRRRKKAVEGILGNIDDYDPEEIKVFIEAINQIDEKGKLTPFCFAIESVLSNYI